MSPRDEFDEQCDQSATDGIGHPRGQVECERDMSDRANRRTQPNEELFSSTRDEVAVERSRLIPEDQITNGIQAFCAHYRRGRILYLADLVNQLRRAGRTYIERLNKQAATITEYQRQENQRDSVPNLRVRNRDLERKVVEYSERITRQANTMLELYDERDKLQQELAEKRQSAEKFRDSSLRWERHYYTMYKKVQPLRRALLEIASAADVARTKSHDK